MAKRKPRGRLELTWMGKDQALVPDPDGKYDYSWTDPSDPRATEVKSLEVLRAVGDDAVAADNLAIIGESGEALRTLSTVPELADKYAGQVKLVYIDPPFNTGQTFDSYEDQLEHSVWLTMMRDRLRWLRPLLAPEASVWVHLDDGEVHRMRSLLDEEFGADCFRGTVIWQKADSPKSDQPAFSVDHDHILVYSVRPEWRSNRMSRLAEYDAIFKAPDGDSRPWASGDAQAPSAHRNQTWVYAIQSPFTGELIYPGKGRCWGQKQDTMQELVEEWGIPYRREVLDDDGTRALICGVSEAEVRKEVPALMVDTPLEEAEARARSRYAAGSWPRFYFTKGGNGGVKLKRYLDEADQTRAPRTLWFNSEVGHSRAAKKEIGRLFPDIAPFSTPKPERLLQRVLQIGSEPGDLVLDFFGGSGTTAAVAHKMGRRWVTVELQEDNAEKYLIPRLSKVVDGSDDGGVSTTVERVADGELPTGVTPREAKDFTSVLDKVAKLDDVEIPADVLRTIKKATKTKNQKTVNWSGGGGFTVAKIGPTMYEVDDGTGDVYLSEAATNGTWSKAVAGQLGFRLDNDPPFVGTKGRMRLVVLDGVVSEDDIENIAAYLGSGERLTVVAKQVLPGAEEKLKKLAPGSRLRRAPDQIIGGTA